MTHILQFVLHLGCVRMQYMVTHTLTQILHFSLCTLPCEVAREDIPNANDTKLEGQPHDPYTIICSTLRVCENVVYGHPYTDPKYCTLNCLKIGLMRQRERIFQMLMIENQKDSPMTHILQFVLHLGCVRMQYMVTTTLTQNIALLST